jgi:hypothetical protein
MQRTVGLVLSFLFAAGALADERFVVFFTKGPSWDAGKELSAQAHIAEHSANIARLQTAGRILIGVRYADTGMLLLTAADVAAAKSEIGSDPAVAAGVLAADVQPARVFINPPGTAVTRTVDITANLSRLTAGQRSWLEDFERGARAHANSDLPAAEWLASTADDARKAGLLQTAAYLQLAAGAVRGQVSIADLERGFRATLGEPVYVMLRVDGTRLVDVVVALPNAEASRPILPASVAAFERTLPGFEEKWIAPIVPEEIARVATLRMRAGKNAGSTGPGSYLPFDTKLNAEIGRTWIIYDNMLPAGWFAKIQPAAEALLPSLASHVTGDALLRWYGLRTPMYDAGPNLSRADLARFAADRDPLRIAKADVLCTLAAGASDDDLATLLAVSLYTLFEGYGGNAPPAHRPGSSISINYLAAHDALHFDREHGVWTANLDAMRKALRDLAGEIIAIESTLDVARAHQLVATYGTPSTDIERSVLIIAALPKVTIVPRYPAAQ